MTTATSYLERLMAVDCCTLSDALDRLQVKGAITGLRQEAGSGRLVGRAVTVKLGVRPPSAGESVRHLGTQAIEMAGPDTVIVIEQRTGIEAACWGGLLSLGAKERAVRGVVADGPVRDIDEARELGFTVFTNRLTCLTARGRVVEEGTNLPVNIGTLTIEPGDYIAADNSGVIAIKPRDIDKVLEVAEAIAAKERAMAGAIREGLSIGSVMGKAYEAMLEGARA